MLPILARTFFRIQERLLGRSSFAILRELRQSQHWDRSGIEALQWERLGRLIAIAYEHTPYWREVMDGCGVRPADIRSLGDLRRLPLLEKQALRTRREEMTWRGPHRRVTLIRTSGSTNEALQFYTSSQREAHINAARMRGHEWIGIRRGQRELYFWGSPVELSKQDRVKRVRDWLVNDGLTDGFRINAAAVAANIEQWKRWRPKCIFGYPSSLVLTATLARQQSLNLRQLKARGLEMICTTSEMLGEVNRRIIAEAFGVPVYDSFGLREGGLVGHECRHQTMHCMDEQVLLEVIDPHTLEPTDGEGELVLTNLVSHVMPLLRYRTGDIVTLSDRPCACGLGLSSIEISGGRIADFIVTRDGRWFAGYAWIYICRAVPGVVKFQVHQEQLGRMRVLLVVDDGFPADGLERVRRAAHARIGEQDQVDVEIVDDIEPAPSGKYRPVISRVADELLAAR